MLILEPLDFVRTYVEAVNEELTKHNPNFKLSEIQRNWLSFCVTAVILTNSINWSSFQRISLRKYSIGALSWMFRCSKIQWDALLYASTMRILCKYGIKEGGLIIDDTGKGRSKVVKKIAFSHKMIDKETGGYIIG
ncbi:hypothetical protein MBAV_006536, partial [Candidatus Magnetobacterium bavaricum]